MAVVKQRVWTRLIPTALALADADAFAVARLEEGLALRAAGVTQPIVLLEGVLRASSCSNCPTRLRSGRARCEQIELLETFSGRIASCSGSKSTPEMNRLGFRPANFPPRSPGCRLEARAANCGS